MTTVKVITTSLISLRNMDQMQILCATFWVSGYAIAHAKCLIFSNVVLMNNIAKIKFCSELG